MIRSTRRRTWHVKSHYLVKVIIRRKSLENVPGVIQKDPINTVNKSATVGRVKNVFLRVDINPTLTYIG